MQIDLALGKELLSDKPYYVYLGTFFLCVLLEIKPKALHVLSKLSTTELRRYLPCCICVCCMHECRFVCVCVCKSVRMYAHIHVEGGDNFKCHSLFIFCFV